MRQFIIAWTVLLLASASGVAGPKSKHQVGLASWYGEAHRGKPMANGKPFNPDKLTAASWFYPLGTKVRVTVAERDFATRSVMVTITDRGPARDLVREGRIIDLGRAAFRRIATTDLGLIQVTVQPVSGPG